MPELLESSDEDEVGGDGSVDAAAAAVAAALGAADAPWLRTPGSARARQRQARADGTTVYCLSVLDPLHTGREQVDPGGVFMCDAARSTGAHGRLRAGGG